MPIYKVSVKEAWRRAGLLRNVCLSFQDWGNLPRLGAKSIHLVDHLPMTPEEKSQCSMRKRAVEGLRQYLEQGEHVGTQ